VIFWLKQKLYLPNGKRYAKQVLRDIHLMVSDILAYAKVVVLIIIYTKTFMSNANKNITPFCVQNGI
jgi:hypothetical protein